MDIRTTRRATQLAIPLILLMLSSILFATAPTADAQSTCRGKRVTVNIGAGQRPTNGNDVIMGTNGADVINAGGGHDIICGLKGNDTINGQAGNDVIDGGNGNDKLFGGSSGHDQIYGGNGADTIWGRNGNDRIWGEGGADKIYGEAGNDQVWGGNGTDTIRGGNGDDTLNGQGSNDKLYGEAGNDTLNGGSGTADTVNGGIGTDTCIGERQSNCENLQAPSWVGGTSAELKWEGVTFGGFEVSWPAVHGNPGQTVAIDINIIDSSGTKFGDTRYGGPGSYTFDDFGGFALDPAEQYTVEITAFNDAGRSRTLPLGPVTVLGGLIPVIETGSPSNRKAASSSAIAAPFITRVECPNPLVTSANYREACYVQETTNGQAHVGAPVSFYFAGGRWSGLKLVTLDARSEISHEGYDVTENNTVFATCTSADRFPFDSVDTAPNQVGKIEASGKALNVFGCNMSDEIPVVVNANATVGIASGGVSTTFTIGLSADLKVVHTIESVTDTFITWRLQAFQADGLNGAILGTDCETFLGKACG